MSVIFAYKRIGAGIVTDPGPGGAPVLRRVDLWSWRRCKSEIDTTVLDQESRDGGYRTLAEMVAELRERFPEDEIVGVGHDDVEADALS